MTSKGKKILIIGAIAFVLLIGFPNTSNAEGLIREFENGSPTAVPLLKAIPDTNGKWQIGFGSTWNYDQNRWVRSTDVITSEQAFRWMRLEIAEKQKLIDDLVTVPLNTNQLTALTSLTYNIGSTAFTDSTLLKILNRGDYQGAADQFLVWKYSGGVFMPGLLARRQRERQIFLS